MNTRAQVIWTALLSLAINLFATVIWESSFCKRWHTGNPLDMAINWLAETYTIPRITTIILGIWAISLSFLYYRLLRKIVVHQASYDSPNRRYDVTQILQDKINDLKLRKIHVTNEFIGNDPEFGIGKVLSIDYSVFGVRKRKSVAEGHELVLD